MTEYRLHELAYEAVLERWQEASEALRKTPRNRIRIAREQRLSEELNELTAWLVAYHKRRKGA